jgi:hypothetical protein
MGGDSKTVSILKIVRGLIRQTEWLLPAAFAKVFLKSGTTDNCLKHIKKVDMGYYQINLRPSIGQGCR